MKEQLHTYVDDAFAQVPYETDEMRAAKQDLKQNLDLQYDQYLTDGYDEKAAYQKTLDQMGDLHRMIGEALPAVIPKEQTDVAQVPSSTAQTPQVWEPKKQKGTTDASSVKKIIWCIILLCVLRFDFIPFNGLLSLIVVFILISHITDLCSGNKEKDKHRNRQLDTITETSSQGLSLIDIIGGSQCVIVDCDADVQNVVCRGNCRLEQRGNKLKVIGSGKGTLHVLIPVDYAGDLHIGTISGDIEMVPELAPAYVHVTAVTTSGDITLEEMMQPVQVKGVSGDIYISYQAVQGKSEINTVSGDVDVEVPEYSDYTVDVSTVSGDIKTVRSMTARHHLTEHYGRSERASIYITTISGDVDVDEL